MAVTFNWQVIPKDKLAQMNQEAKAEGYNTVAWLKSKWSVTITFDYADPVARYRAGAGRDLFTVHNKALKQRVEGLVCPSAASARDLSYNPAFLSIHSHTFTGTKMTKAIQATAMK